VRGGVSAAAAHECEHGQLVEISLGAKNDHRGGSFPG
jgi:hypothetical protein